MSTRSSSRFYIRNMVISAMLVAAGIALRPLTFYIGGDFLRVSFMIIPIAVAGMLVGIPYAAAVGVCMDIAGYFLFPSGGSFFPGFAITGALEGVVFGLFLYKRKPSVLRTLLAALIIAFPLHIILNTYWLHLLHGTPYMALFWIRGLKEIILIPFHWITFYMISRFAIPPIRKIIGQRFL